VLSILSRNLQQVLEASLTKTLAQEIRARFGIEAIADDPDNDDHAHPASIEGTNVVGRVLSPYGEGVPRDNAASFDKFSTTLSQDESSPNKALEGLEYFAFGLGSKEYQY
jgi:sulfite reductase alpha subunit-like flavoprotein